MVGIEVVKLTKYGFRGYKKKSLNFVFFFYLKNEEGWGGPMLYKYNMVGRVHIAQVWPPELCSPWKSSCAKKR